jgi:hypothetical protein
MPKRKAAQVGGASAEPELRRSTRRKSSAPQTATKRALDDGELAAKVEKSPVKARKVSAKKETRDDDEKTEVTLCAQLTGLCILCM